MHKVKTPCVEEDQMAARAKAPCARGPRILCDGCGHPLPDKDTYRYNSLAEVRKDTPKPESCASCVRAADRSFSETEVEEVTKVALHEALCSVRMEILSAARLAIPDLQRPTVR